MDITTILWLFCAGISAALIIGYYNARVLGKTVRALIDIDATSPESAIALEELGLKITPMLKNSMRNGKSLSEIVKTTEDGKYYIAPNKLEMAKSKYKGKDISLVFIIACIALLVVVCLVLTYVFPGILESFTNRINAIFSLGESR